MKFHTLKSKSESSSREESNFGILTIDTVIIVPLFRQHGNLPLEGLLSSIKYLSKYDRNFQGGVSPKEGEE